MMKETRWIPETPGGSILMELSADTEAKAWKNLLRDAAHMPYKTVENFKKRGYKVLKWTEK